MQEQWKPCVGLEDRYAVSNIGRFKNVKTGKVLKASTSQRYARIATHTLGPNRKTICLSIHREVAKAFIPNPHNYPVVNHKDFNRFNNCVENLEWCTTLHNNRHARVGGRHPDMKGQFLKVLTDDEITFIKENYLFKSGKFGINALARQIGCCYTIVRRAIKEHDIQPNPKPFYDKAAEFRKRKRLAKLESRGVVVDRSGF